MNYLAHIYLSGDDTQLRIGNFIGDHVKGKSYQKFHKPVQEGILLHRKIDHYTDSHKIVEESKEIFRPHYGRYSGVVTDIVWDHFLAKNWPNYSDITLREYTKTFHHQLIKHFAILPLRVQQFVPFLIRHRRLESYASISGIQETLAIMGRRTSMPKKEVEAIAALNTNYEYLEQNAKELLEDLHQFLPKGNSLIK